MLTFFSIVGQAQTTPDTITVHFQFSSKAKGESAIIVYSDFIGGNSVSLHPNTDRNGEWTVKIPTFDTLHIQIWDANKIEGVVWGALNLFCRPGTITEILLDDVNDHCIFSGDDAEIHQAQITHPLKIENFHGQMFGMDILEAATHIRNIHKKNLHMIDTLCTAHPDLPSRYVEGLRAMANYGYAMDMTQNIQGHYVDSITSILERGNNLPQCYVELLREVETNDLLHPQGLLSRDAATYFCDVVSMENIVRNGIICEAIESKGDDMLEQFKSRCYVINSIDASDTVKQMMKTATSLVLFQTEITQKREEFMRSQLTADAFGQFKTYINGMKAQLEDIPDTTDGELEETPIDSLVNGKDIFQKLITPYRGRVIYVDIWGTWCGPCMREMENVAQLHETLHDLPVTYMYLANQSPEELWKKSAKRFGLDGEDCLNLRLPDNQQKAVEDYLGVQAFPTFLIIAPDGTIVTNKAPRPSNPSGVREAISKLFEKLKIRNMSPKSLKVKKELLKAIK